MQYGLALFHSWSSAIKSVYNGEPEKLLGTATGEEPPPENAPIPDGAPTTPPSPTGGPEQNAYNYAKKGVGY